jgi:acetyl esterase/lipase
MRNITRPALVAMLAAVAAVGISPAHAGTPTVSNMIRVLNDTAVITVTEHQYYGIDPRQRLDAYIHDARVTGGRPWIIVWHGGSWVNANKANTAAMSQRWFNEGYNVFNAEYQPAYKADGTPYLSLSNGGGKPATWPQTRVDTALAVNYIKANASAFNINANRGGAYGFSSGGHLAALYGAYYNGVQAVMSVAGVLKPDYVAVMGETGSLGSRPATTGMRKLWGYETAMMGCVERSWTACGQKWSTFYPEKYLSSTRPAYYIVQGDRDEVIPYETLDGFAYWLGYHGLTYTKVRMAGYGHTESMVGAGTTGWNNAVAWMGAHTRAN